MAKLYPKKLKRHAFIDCTGWSFSRGLEERRSDLVTDLRLLSCGQCKGRILDVIRFKDWFDLDPVVLKMLNDCANTSRKAIK